MDRLALIAALTECGAIAKTGGQRSWLLAWSDARLAAFLSGWMQS